MNRPLFLSTTSPKFQACRLILNCAQSQKCASNFINKLFRLFHNSVLLPPNSLPGSEYEASKQLRKLGLQYKTYDVCPNSCMLLRGPGNEDLQACLYCGAARYRRHRNLLVPMKVLRHFPIKPRLQRMCAHPHQAHLLTWHNRNRSKDDKVRRAIDSE